MSSTAAGAGARADGNPETSPRKGGLRWLHWALSLAILAGLGLAAAKYLRADAVLDSLRTFQWAYAAPLLLLSAGYLLLKGWRFIALLRPLSELPAGTIMRAYLAGQPATFIPGGVAARAGLLAEVGVPPGASSVPILHGSILDQLMFALATLGAALFFPAARGIALIILGVLAALALLLAIPAARRMLGGLVEKLLKRFKQQKLWDDFAAGIAAVNTPRTLGLALALSIASFIVPVVMFELVLRALGSPVSFGALLLAYTVPTMVSRLTVLPGGLGLMEGGMVGMLSSTAGVDPNTGAAAAALHRIADSFFQALLGAVVYFAFWRSECEKHAASTACPPEQRGQRIAPV